MTRDKMETQSMYTMIVDWKMSIGSLYDKSVSMLEMLITIRYPKLTICFLNVSEIYF